MVYVYVFLLGLCLGSFVNALVWRMHEQNQPKAKSPKLKANTLTTHELSIIKGRSMCVHCHHQLTWYDLLPVFSWLSLRGRCRYCSKPISVQYPLVEVLTAVLFIISYIFWPLDLNLQTLVLFVLWLVIVVCFMALLVYDLKWMLLPNRIVYPLIGIAVVYALFRVLLVDKDWLSVTAAIGGLLAVGGLFWLLFQLSGGKWIGGGDVKLGFALGLLLGTPILGLLMIFVASCLGTVAVLPSLVSGERKSTSKVPFGPFLITASVVVFLFGQSFVDNYQQMFF